MDIRELLKAQKERGDKRKQQQKQPVILDDDDAFQQPREKGIIKWKINKKRLQYDSDSDEDPIGTEPKSITSSSTGTDDKPKPAKKKKITSLSEYFGSDPVKQKESSSKPSKGSSQTNCAKAKRNPDHMTPLHYASEWGRIDIVKILLQEGADVNAFNEWQQTPLHDAVLGGHIEVIKILLAKGADINAKNEDNESPLELAVRSGQRRIVQYLVEENYINISQLNEDIRELLKAQKERGDKRKQQKKQPVILNDDDAFQQPREKGIIKRKKNKKRLQYDSDSDEDPIGTEPKSITSSSTGTDDKPKPAKKKKITSLSEYFGSDPVKQKESSSKPSKGSSQTNCAKAKRNPDHMTPLHHASEHGTIDIVKILLQEGADVNAFDEYHQTPLHYAAREGHTDIVQLLIDKGGDIHAKDKDNDTPLIVALKDAVENEFDSDVVSMLLNKGAKVDVKDGDHVTLLHGAARCDNTAIVNMMLEEGVDVDIQNEWQQTPLHYAVLYGHIEVIKILLAKGADINAKNEFNLSPLEHAIEMDQRTIVQYLVKENYIDTSQLNEEMRTKLDNLVVDQLTVEDVNEGYMNGELLGPDIRVALLGAEGSGKTCLSHTLVGKDFEDTAPTEGAAHMEIVVESTTNWKPLTHDEKLEDLDKQKCLESVSSAIKLLKSQPTPSSRPSKPAVSTSEGSSVSSVSSTTTLASLAPATHSTPPVYSTPTIQTHVPQSNSAALSTPSPNSSSETTSTSSVPHNQSVHSASNDSTDSSASIIPPSVDSSSNVLQQAITPPAKKQKLSSNINDNGSFVSVYAIENLKAFKQSYDPKKRYVNIWDFAGQQVFQHTHGIFVSEEVVCLIVFDASLALDEVPERRYPNDCTPRRTVLETICYWMELISSRVSRPSTSDDDLSIRLPTFILVGTHIDKVSHNICIVQDACFEIFLPIFKIELVGRPFSDHIAGSKHNQLFVVGSPSLFFICNLQESRDSFAVNALKQTVMQASSVTRQTRPTRYVEIERKLMLLSKQVGIVGFNTIAKVAKSCGLSSNKEELLKMTKYLHHKGSLLHFRNVPSLSSTIILSPCWLTKMITCVLTSLTCLPIDPVLARFAEKRQNEGLLEEKLIHWSVEQFNKTESEYNCIIANLRGIPIIELFTNFQLMVDVTQSSIAGHKPRGEGNRLFLVPHLLPFKEVSQTKDFSFKILYNFPAHFIPDNLIDQLIVKCAQWNNDRQYDLIRLSYQWVCFELGKYQTYQLRPNYKIDSIELTIIPDPSMPSQYEEENYKESNKLIDAVKEFIDNLMEEHMTATFKEFPVECYIPCPECSQLHVKLKKFSTTGNAFCDVKNGYSKSPDFAKYHKMLSAKSCIKSAKKYVGIYSSPPSPYVQTPKMKHLSKYVIPKIAHEWETVADFLDYDINTTKVITVDCRDAKKCCDRLFRDWLTTNHGASPKTWGTLLTALKETDLLATAVSEIEKDLNELLNKP